MGKTRQDSCGDNALSISDLIGRKRDGKALLEEEIEFFVQGVVEGSIQGAQIGWFINHLF
jgi:thymidine phosphorylase